MTNQLGPWRCDACGQDVSAGDGYVRWGWDSERRPREFQIIHKGQCDVAKRDFPGSSPLTAFLGDDGFANLTSFLSAGPVMDELYPAADRKEVGDLDGFVDFMRRVQLPHYEQARPRLRDHDIVDRLSDANETFPYLQDMLREIASSPRDGSEAVE